MLSLVKIHSKFSIPIHSLLSRFLSARTAVRMVGMISVMETAKRAGPTKIHGRTLSAMVARR